MAIDTNIAEEEVRLPRQVSTANIISDQPAGDIFNFVETYFLKWARCYHNLIDHIIYISLTE